MWHFCFQFKLIYSGSYWATGLLWYFVILFQTRLQNLIKYLQAWTKNKDKLFYMRDSCELGSHVCLAKFGLVKWDSTWLVRTGFEIYLLLSGFLMELSSILTHRPKKETFWPLPSQSTTWWDNKSFSLCTVLEWSTAKQGR